MSQGAVQLGDGVDLDSLGDQRLVENRFGQVPTAALNEVAGVLEEVFTRDNHIASVAAGAFDRDPERASRHRPRRRGLGRFHRRARPAAGIVGTRAVVVQAIDERAKAFYGRFGFCTFSDCDPLMLVLRISELDALLAR